MSDNAKPASGCTSPSDCSVPDGLHDNPMTFRRESYRAGKIISFLNAELIINAPEFLPCSDRWKRPWESYDAPNAPADLPAVAGKVRRNVRNSKRTHCPECHAALIFANTLDGQDVYCEECGWPDECLPENPPCVICKRPAVGECGDTWRCEDHWVSNAGLEPARKDG